MINKNIKFLRQQNGLTQPQFAEIFNLNRGKVSSYEASSVPSPQIIIAIAKHFDVALEDFMSKDLSQNPAILDAQVNAQVNAQVKTNSKTNSTYFVKEPVVDYNRDTKVKELEDAIEIKDKLIEQLQQQIEFLGKTMEMVSDQWHAKMRELDQEQEKNG